MLNEDGLSDPEGRGHLREGSVCLVGELRKYEVVERSRGVADGAKDGEGDRKEVAGGREVFADGVFELLAVEGGGVRSIAVLGALRLDKRVGESEIKMQLLSREARMPLGRETSARQVGLP